MKRTLGPLVLALALTYSGFADDKKDGKFDPSKMVGEWRLVAGVRSGEKVDGDHLKDKVKVTKETIILEGEQGKFVMAYTLNPAVDPVTIDLEIKEGPVPEGKFIGIISVNDDEMRICYIPAASAMRPVKYESTKENGAFFWTLKRTK